MEPKPEEKANRKRALDGIRRASAHLDPKEIRSAFEAAKQATTDTKDNLFPIMSALRTALNTVDAKWLFGKGMEKAIQVRIPGAVILCDSLKLEENILKHLNGNTFISGNRALIWTKEKMYYCDISSSNPAALAAQHNSDAISSMQTYLHSTGRGIDPTQQLKQMIIDAGCLCFDYEDAPKSEEFDCDETPSFFQEGWLDELKKRIAWQEWLETATDEEIDEQIRHDPSVFAWMLEDAPDNTHTKASSSVDPTTKAKVLKFVRKNGK